MPRVAPVFPNLLSAFFIKGVALRNRICSTAHYAKWMSDEDGLPNDEFIAYMQERARGGIGLLTVGATAVREDGGEEYFKNVDDRFVDGYRRVAESVHKHGAALFAQLMHCGDQHPVIPGTPGRRLQFGEDLPELPRAATAPAEPVSPRPSERTVEDLQDIVRCFASAALRAKAGGVDGVELHAHERYLLAQFLSPVYNTRTDVYGGSFENRIRLLFETLTAMRREVGDDFVLGVRLKASDFHPQGMTEKDYIQLILELERNRLIDYVSLTAGTDQIHHGPMYLPDGDLLPLVGRVREKINVPVIHAGRITDPYVAERAVSSCQVDLVGMTKAHIADASLAIKLAQGRIGEIRPCIRCLHCLEIEPVTCLYNPLTGGERQWSSLQTAPVPKRVLVIGAGPAGVEAALTAAQRGHHVTVWEKSKVVGGQVLLAGAGPLRRKLLEIADFYERLSRRGLFQTVTSMEVGPETILGFDPQIVIVATGSTPMPARLDGFDPDKVFSVRDAVSGKVPRTKRVLIVDRLGRHQAFVAADVLAEAGCEVHYISPLDRVGKQLGDRDGGVLYQKLSDKGVSFKAGLDTAYSTGATVVLREVHTLEEVSFGQFDAVVFAEEERPVAGLAETLASRVRQLLVVGAAAGARSIREATLDGARVARKI